MVNIKPLMGPTHPESFRTQNKVHIEEIKSEGLKSEDAFNPCKKKEAEIFKEKTPKTADEKKSKLKEFLKRLRII